MMQPEKHRLFYILSASHSGSTLLSMILNAHPDICTAGELKATSLGDKEQYLCSCRNKIRECQFWTAISQDMLKRGSHFDITNAGTDVRTGASHYTQILINPLHRGIFLEGIRDIALNFSSTWRNNIKKIQTLNSNLVDCLLSRTRKKVIVDSSKVGIRLKFLLRNSSLDVFIIRLIRDGRAVSLTYMNPAQFADADDPRFRGGGIGGNRELEQLPMKKAAWEWRRSNEEAAVILKHIPRSRWIEIRYEDLCMDREYTLRKIYTFMNVDPDKSLSDFRSVEHHVIGNGMRLNQNSEIKFDDRWKTMLKVPDLETFEHIAGKINRRLGYQ